MSNTPAQINIDVLPFEAHQTQICAVNVHGGKLDDIDSIKLTHLTGCDEPLIRGVQYQLVRFAGRNMATGDRVVRRLVIEIINRHNVSDIRHKKSVTEVRAHIEDHYIAEEALDDMPIIDTRDRAVEEVLKYKVHGYHHVFGQAPFLASFYDLVEVDVERTLAVTFDKFMEDL